MCGIAGIIRWNGAPVSATELERMTEALVHRGPDGRGYHVAGSIGLGHTRLAIIDPAGGHQPMLAGDRRAAITYNGELYNFRELRSELEGLGHRFTTACDTEVVLRAWLEWQEACVQRFRGMFAFAIVDWDRERVFLARDHFGMKPLVYFTDSTQLCFASELQALRRADGCPKRLDLAALDQYLALSYVPAPLTAFEGVRKLEPAHSLVAHFDGRVEQPVRYWELQRRPVRHRSHADWLHELEAVLRDSVRAHLVSDVPFGAWLSGGVDSSLVVSLMAQEMNRPVETFSIGFRESAYDELGHAAAVRDRWRTRHHERVVTSDTLAALPKLVEHYGEPFGDWSALPVFSLAELARERVAMVLSGDGSDEAFAGYKRYTRLLPNRVSRLGLLRRLLDGWLAHAPGWEAQAMMVLRAPARRALWRREHAERIEDESAPAARAWARARDLPPLLRARVLDYATYLPGAILTKVDIAAMVHGLEVRTPFVDRNVVELAATVPDELLIDVTRDATEFQGKRVLRDLLERWFPPAFVRRPKQGFVPPVLAWLARGNESRGTIEDVLFARDARIGEYFEPPAVRRLVASLDGAGPAEPVWLLFYLETWLRSL